VTPDGRWLVVAALRQNRIVTFDLTRGERTGYIEVGEFPYTVVAHPDNTTLFVSNWGGKSISVVDLATGSETDRIPVGSHPNAMRLSADGSRLYVTNANSNDISIIDVGRRAVVETIDLSPYSGAPSGTTPNGIALSSDGRTLYVVNADNNDVAVIDVTQSPARVKGLIPTGWYPTAVALADDAGLLLVASAKGLGSKSNPLGPQPTINYPRTIPEMQYIGRLFPGTLSFVDLPSDRVLADYTAQVVRNNGFDRMDGTLSVADATDVTPRAIPRRVGEPSLIKYVFYIIKENRTYDQVFGDLPQGEGDSTLTLFGRNVSPNHHALAENFVLFDNFYVDAEVSADGHEWSMGAIATDFVEKLWPTGYSSRGFPFVAEGSFEIAYPDAGYLWDAAARAGVTYRSYGEFVRYGPNRSYPVQTRLANLQGHVAPDYPPYDLRVTDVERAAEFIRDFEELVAGDSVPQLNIIRLPNDHTAGTRPGYPTPLSMMADNDLALGRIVEAISRSPIWDETAIFVVEDDSQNGPDHIDSHRTIALVASPYAKRGFVDHTMYDTVSMLKTMELILGLAPLSQYDAAAIPMVLAFQDEADTTPFTALPNRFPLDSLNAPDAFGAELSMRMNLEELDAAPEELLNEIIWKSVKGPASEMPRPHTTRTWIDLDGDDDEEKNEERH
jgi:YVTN family beta-propeller protein